jgi:tetratricopeptide (TPR) repeat protein
LMQTGNFDTAERLADTALNEFPASAEIALRREKARQSVPRRVSATSPDLPSLSEALSEEESSLRQALLRLVAAEAAGELPEAMAMLQEAMQKYPDRTAFRIAEVYLQGKLAGAGTGEGK